MSARLKASLMNGCSNNVHVGCLWNRRSNRDVGDGMVTFSAIQLTALHDKPYPGIQRGKEKEDDQETHGATIWKQASKKLDTPGDTTLR